MRKKLSSMQYGKMHFAILMISILSLSFFFPGVPVFGAQGQGKLQVVAIQGLAKVEGQDAVVEILVAVQPGENAKAKAREKLRRMYPDAEEIDSSKYSLTGLDWNNDPDFQNTPQVTIVYNGIGVPVSFDASVKNDSYNTWNNVATSIFEFKDDGTTSECPSLVKECKGRQYFNGDNEIAWLDIRENSVLGVVWSGTSSTGPEFDMALDNADFNWYVGTEPNDILPNQIDLQTVWIHEFGHGLGLGHSNVSGSVMEAVYDGPRRVLHPDDEAGITLLYPASNVDLPPTVTITSPVDGETFVENTDISYEGTFDDGGEGDVVVSPTWELTDSSGSNKQSLTGGTIFGGLPIGDYTITASIKDLAGNEGSDSVNITVVPPGAGDPNDIYVWAIDFSEKRKGRGGSMVDLITTVTISRDSDADSTAEDTDELVGGATVQITLARDGNSFNFSGTTNSEGTVKFTLQRALNTPYTATVTSVSHSIYNYNNLLNVETQDTYTIQ